MSALEPRSGPRRIRTKSFAPLVFVVGAATALALWLAPRELEQREHERIRTTHRFASEARRNDEQRQTVLLKGLCRSILRKPRVQAALEEDSVADLYASVRTELEQLVVIEGTQISGRDAANRIRFLDKNGALIPPPGTVREAWESQIPQGHIPDTQEMVHVADPHGSVLELLTTPILDSDTDEKLYAMVLCLPRRSSRGGVWLNGALCPTGLTAVESANLQAAITPSGEDEYSALVQLGGVPTLVFCEPINPRSKHPPAWQLVTYPLTESVAKMAALRFRITVIGSALVVAAFGAFYIITTTKNLK